MHSSQAVSRPQQTLVVWILWAAFLAGVCLIYFFLARPVSPASPPPRETLPWLAGVVPVFLAAIVRWMVLPRFRGAEALPWFVIGIALSEAACFLGIFLFPAHQRELFALSLLGIVQFVPVWAKRAFAEPEADPLRG